MVTFDKVIQRGYKQYVEGKCKSTDPKPTEYANGSILLEMDTATVYMFDEASEVWRAWE